MADISIMVATPVYGEIVYTPYMQSLLRLQRALHQRNGTMRFATISYAYIAESRDFLLTQWFDRSQDSHLLFVDSDMGFEPQLVLDMLAFDKPITGVIYTKRQVDLARVVSLAAKGEPAERAIAGGHDFIIRPVRGRAPRRVKGFIEVEGCGTGVMLIKRSAIAEMIEKLPGIVDTNAKKTSPLTGNLDRLIRAFDQIEVGGVPLVDDFAFCYRWQNLCKGELWARIDRSVTHMGIHKFESRYMDAGSSGPRVTVRSEPVRLGGDRKGGKGTSGNGKAPAHRVVTGQLSIPAKGRPGGK